MGSGGEREHKTSHKKAASPRWTSKAPGEPPADEFRVKESSAYGLNSPFIMHPWSPSRALVQRAGKCSESRRDPKGNQPLPAVPELSSVKKPALEEAGCVLGGAGLKSLWALQLAL